MVSKVVVGIGKKVVIGKLKILLVVTILAAGKMGQVVMLRNGQVTILEAIGKVLVQIGRNQKSLLKVEAVSKLVGGLVDLV